MLKVSFGSNNGNQNSRTVNRNATLTAPSLIVSGLKPGYYTVTMARIGSRGITDIKYLHWMKVNMPSTIKDGKDVLVYEAPLSDFRVPPLVPAHFVITLWHQAAGRFVPPPQGPPRPQTKARFLRFLNKNFLDDVAHVQFSVGA